MRGDSDYEIPEVRYDDHYRYLTSVWASVLVLLIATVLFQILHVMVDSVAALSQASRGGSDDERQPLAGSNGQPRGEYDSGGGRGDQQRTTFMGMGERDRSTLSNRLRRAVDTCQRALLVGFHQFDILPLLTMPTQVLLTAVTFLSVPLQTKCYPNIPDTPPPTPPPPSPPPVLPPPPFEMLSRGGHHDFHHSCLTNSLSLSSVILAWVFTALSVLWAAIGKNLHF
ncbi:hypothetical protein HK101_002498 [Irineochytrium annulatum]|nr:hypothetical protein HK101_002498 [Irineochytrium annulatum]